MADKLTETVERAREIVGRLVEGDSDNPERVARADRYYDGKEDNSLAVQAVTAALTPAGEDDLVTRLRADADRWMAGDTARDNEEAALLSHEAAERIAALSRPNVDDILAGIGWVYSNDGADEEYAPDHPVESGEVPGATNIRRSTQMEDALNDHVQCLFQATLSRPNVDEQDIGALRYVLNFAGTNTRVSTVMRAFTLPDRMTTEQRLERLYAALNGSGNHG